MITMCVYCCSFELENHLCRLLRLLTVVRVYLRYVTYLRYIVTYLLTYLLTYLVTWLWRRVPLTVHWLLQWKTSAKHRIHACDSDFTLSDFAGWQWQKLTHTHTHTHTHARARAHWQSQINNYNSSITKPKLTTQHKNSLRIMYNNYVHIVND